jgi:hypothetical protein
VTMCSDAAVAGFSKHTQHPMARYVLQPAGGAITCWAAVLTLLTASHVLLAVSSSLM